MNNKIKIVLLILTILLLVSVIFLLCLTSQAPKNIVVIVQNGEVIETLDLSKEHDRIFTITSENGSRNTVCIKNGTIFIQSADCPDQTCVHMGVLKNEASPIVCLPNKLLIRFSDTEAD